MSRSGQSAGEEKEWVKTTRYSPEQITLALHQAESCVPPTGVCLKMGSGEQTYLRRKQRYLGMGVA